MCSLKFWSKNVVGVCIFFVLSDVEKLFLLSLFSVMFVALRLSDVFFNDLFGRAVKYINRLVVINVAFAVIVYFCDFSRYVVLVVF